MEYTIRPNEILVKLDENHLYDIKEKIIVFQLARYSSGHSS